MSDGDARTIGVGKREKRRPSPSRPPVTAEQLLTASTDPRALLPLPVVCTLISMCAASVYKMVKKGTFPPPIKVGHASRWKAAQVHAWMQAHGGGDAPSINFVTDATETTGATARQLARLTEQVDALSKIVDLLHRRLSRVGQALTMDR